MTDDLAPPSQRAKDRAAGRARRAQKAAARQAYFEALTSGFSLQHIAEAANVSVATVRRELDRAIAERRLDAPDRYIHLQVARLTKALRLVDMRIDRGELAAVFALTKLATTLDRYHGLAAKVPSLAPPSAGLAPPASPLALAYASQPADPVAPDPPNVADSGA
jgi:hypothetical protein